MTGKRNPAVSFHVEEQTAEKADTPKRMSVSFVDRSVQREETPSADSIIRTSQAIMSWRKEESVSLKDFTVAENMLNL